MGGRNKPDKIECVQCNERLSVCVCVGVTLPLVCEEALFFKADYVLYAKPVSVGLFFHPHDDGVCGVWNFLLLPMVGPGSGANICLECVFGLQLDNGCWE